MAGLEFFINYNDIIHRLKGITRTGWIRSGISDGESVAEHSYHVTLIAIYLSRILKDWEIDIEKLIILSLLHDAAESVYGDIVSPEKSELDVDREYKWLEGFIGDIGYPMDWVDTLKDSSSPEYIILRLSDHLATSFQALSYLERGIYKERYIHDILHNNLADIQSLVEEYGLEPIKEIIDYINNRFESYIKRRS